MSSFVVLACCVILYYLLLKYHGCKAGVQLMKFAAEFAAELDCCIRNGKFSISYATVCYALIYAANFARIYVSHTQALY